ncbi:hypothetical protein ASC97_20540 [Rhizobium sp. Root1203]|nr:hypothetical protein ASC97_20540 [Rhizobium sp. Root1203]
MDAPGFLLELLDHDRLTFSRVSPRLNVSVPDIDRDVARQLIHAAHEICPYSKAIRGNIDVETNLI